MHACILVMGTDACMPGLHVCMWQIILYHIWCAFGSRVIMGTVQRDYQVESGGEKEYGLLSFYFFAK